MKVNEKLSILFLLEKSKAGKNGLVPIYVRITVEGTPRAEMSLGKKIDPDFWDQTKEAVKITPKNKEMAIINTVIKNYRAKLEKDYFILASQHPIVTSQMLKTYFLGKPTEDGDKKKPESITLMKAVEFKVNRQKEKEQKNLLAPATITKWETTKTKIASFIKHKYQQDDIPIENVELTFAEDFLHYLLVEEGVSQNTAMKYISNTKQVLKLAKGRWIKENPLNDFQCPYVQPDRNALTIYDLLSIYNKKFITRLEEVKDVFLFCCFTGFAYKEVESLSANHIFIGNDGKIWIETKRQKTDGKEGLPLLPVALEIIEKYKNNAYCKIHNKLLPVNSNTKYNAYLKEVADICGIKINLTTHVARHTFATTVTLENDVPLETVSKMLGHKSIKTTQIYAKITQKKISNNMQVLKNKLFGKSKNQKGNFHSKENLNRDQNPKLNKG